MTPDRETLMAYVDGELDAPARTAFDAALATDASLREAVLGERKLRLALAAAYDPVLDEPVPARLLAALAERPDPATATQAAAAAGVRDRDAAQVHDLAAARAAQAARAQAARALAAPARRTWAWPEWAALAACLVVGLALGMVINVSQHTGSPAERMSLVGGTEGGGTLRATGMLDRQLTQALAAEPAADVAVGLSFVAQDGRYCRSFAVAGTPPTAGLACRDAEGWAVQALMPAAPAPSAAAASSFRMAATALPPALLQLVDSLRAADTLDAAAERAARDRGWRR